MANIRNQNSWVHKSNPDLATKKARDLVRMAVFKVALMAPLKEAELEVDQTAMVVGGGISGMAAARSLARQGYETHIIEKSSQLGGQAKIFIVPPRARTSRKSCRISSMKSEKMRRFMSIWIRQ